MSTSKINKEMKNEEMYFHDMDFNFYENPDTIVDQYFHGKEGDLPLYCVLHDTKPLRCVASKGSDTGRRFYGCAVKRYLLKLWKFLHKGNSERHEQKEEISKLKRDIKQLNLKLMNLERQKKQIDIDHKELKSIHACLQGAFQNIEEERDDTKLDRDFLEEEVNMRKGNKKKMETVISGLVEKGCANRYELLTINEILEE
uniref:Zinc finger GRF-type domain-containing protein n=1 Tax=Hordeum vulgare subsp. vulgare TaxID=112509 RepID=A0A8I6X699_HORVV